MGFVQNFLFGSKVHSILVPLLSLALELLLHSAAHFAVTEMSYFPLVAELHMEFEVYFQLIYKSVCYRSRHA